VSRRSGDAKTLHYHCFLHEAEILDALRRGAFQSNHPDDIVDAWAEQAAKWEEGYGHLAAYVQAEGHARVPRNHRTAEDYPLAGWVTRQRTTKDSMPADRRQRLGDVGFVWDAKFVFRRKRNRKLSILSAPRTRVSRNPRSR